MKIFRICSIWWFGRQYSWESRCFVYQAPFSIFRRIWQYLLSLTAQIKASIKQKVSIMKDASLAWNYFFSLVISIRKYIWSVVYVYLFPFITDDLQSRSFKFNLTSGSYSNDDTRNIAMGTYIIVLETV